MENENACVGRSAAAKKMQIAVKKLLNGRCIPNKCTYFAKQGMSNCDTWLGSEEILLAAVAGDVSGPLSQSDHAMVKVCLRFWLQPSAQDSFLEFLRSQGSKKHTWKMRRGPILATLDDNTALQQSLADTCAIPVFKRHS